MCTPQRTKMLEKKGKIEAASGGEAAINRAHRDRKQHPRQRKQLQHMSLLRAAALLFAGFFAQGVNCKTIADTAEWKDCVSNPARCSTLDLTDSSLTGPIPAAIGNLCKEAGLYRIVISGTKVSGSIPVELGECTRLDYL